MPPQQAPSSPVTQSPSGSAAAAAATAVTAAKNPAPGSTASAHRYDAATHSQFLDLPPAKQTVSASAAAAAAAKSAGSSSAHSPSRASHSLNGHGSSDKEQQLQQHGVSETTTTSSSSNLTHQPTASVNISATPSVASIVTANTATTNTTNTNTINNNTTAVAPSPQSIKNQQPSVSPQMPFANAVTGARRRGLSAKLVKPGSFEPEHHFYPRVLNAQLHPLVSSFISLGNERIIARYTHLNPQVDANLLRKALGYRPRYFRWAGCDLFSVTTAEGRRQMIVIETNSCPSGQKSMPTVTEHHDEASGFRTVLASAFHEAMKGVPKRGSNSNNNSNRGSTINVNELLTANGQLANGTSNAGGGGGGGSNSIEQRRPSTPPWATYIVPSAVSSSMRSQSANDLATLPQEVDPSAVQGDLAVISDKNVMEASGYAAALADETGETIWFAEFYEDDPDPPCKWEDGVLYVRDSEGAWHPIRACFRYVTQRPWRRIPLHTRTRVMNPIVSCLAGGRNKMMADKAYAMFNAELTKSSGLQIRVPQTTNDVEKQEIPEIIRGMGGHAVLKVPYSNAGQGVYTITNEKELADFMAEEHRYDKFIVQSLVGNASWSSTTSEGKFFHVGTIPNRRNHTYVTDVRMMVAADSSGFRPVCIYARRARKPLVTNLGEIIDDGSSTVDVAVSSNGNEHGGILIEGGKKESALRPPTSWEMLGTNLSVKNADGSWSTEAQRLLLMDRKDFNQLGLGIDDLIDGYIQTVLAVIAIDRMCLRLHPVGGTFDVEQFMELNLDQVLLDELKLQ
ncbi:hypothetical protein GQ42DRAFT_164978 [Ramicandelaber brevisporus]|nr:hypothetical protein GQ42DRAFT_164978 [Ramicandelaber brevisporus]